MSGLIWVAALSIILLRAMMRNSFCRPKPLSSALPSLKVWLEYIAGGAGQGELELWQGLNHQTSKFAFPCGPHVNKHTF